MISGEFSKFDFFCYKTTLVRMSCVTYASFGAGGSHLQNVYHDYLIQTTLVKVAFGNITNTGHTR